MASQAEEDQNLSSVNPLALQNNKQVLSRLCVHCSVSLLLHQPTRTCLTCTSCHGRLARHMTERFANTYT